MGLESEARSYFGRSFNCAQSVFVPLAEKLGLDVDTALKIATPFGGGIAHSGQICGAVSGGLMAIGLAKGITEYNHERKDACYALAQEFMDRFTELHGELTCSGLLGLDLGDPAQSKIANKENVFSTLCPIFVRDAVRIVGEMIDLEG